MTIGSVTGISSKIAPPAQPNGFRDALQQSISLVAARLGMSVNDLRTHMQFGKTLADVANEVGVSRPDLASAVRQVVSQSGFAQSGNSVEATTDRIVNFKANTARAVSAPEARGVEGAQGNLGIQAGQAPLSSYNASGADTDGDRH